MSACDRCHSRKIRCDNKTPCLPCQKCNAECQRRIVPEFFGYDSASVSVDDDREAPQPPDDPVEGDSYTAPLPGNHNIQSTTHLPETQPAFRPGTLPFTSHRLFPESDISVSQQADTSPLTRPDSRSPNRDGGALEFAKGADRSFDSIRDMSLATIIDHEEPSVFNNPPLVNSVVETNSASAQSTPSTQVIPSASTRNTSYSSFSSEGVPHFSYYSYLDNEETAPGFAEHRATIQSILHDAVIERYFQLFHPQWPLLHKETFQQNPGQLELLLSVALLGSMLEENPTKLDALKSLHKAVLWRLEAKMRQVCADMSISKSAKINITVAI